jgi:hypothetical protein
VSWPGGFRTDGPPDPVGSATDDAVGGADGIALVALGGMGLAATLAVEVLGDGLATAAALRRRERRRRHRLGRGGRRRAVLSLRRRRTSVSGRWWTRTTDLFLIREAL